MSMTAQAAARVLVIDDAAAMHDILNVRLRSENIEPLSAFDGPSGIAMAQSLCPDLILLDVDMPGMDGYEVIRRLKNDPRTMYLPVLFLTGACETRKKIEGLTLGAADYITKPFDSAELKARVNAHLRTKHLMDLLARKALIDGLTGLWNREYLDRHLPIAVSQATRGAHPLACIMLDIDHFKSVNDRFGHATGDEVIRHVAGIMSEVSRQHDVACRYGGEEFAMLLPDTDAAGAAALAERLRATIADRPVGRGLLQFNVSCSLGVAELRSASAGQTDDVVEAADRALYRAKAAGRNRVVSLDRSAGATADPDAQITEANAAQLVQ